MRTFCIAVLLTFTMVSAGVISQTAGSAPPKYPSNIVHVPAAKVNEIVATQKGGTNNGGNEILPRDLDLGIRASVGKKVATPPVTEAEVHSDFGHIFQIAEGEGTLVLGGELVNPRRAGTGWNGTAIKGGQEFHMKKGDLITVQVGMPHWWKDVPQGVTYIAYHIFPKP